MGGFRHASPRCLYVRISTGRLLRDGSALGLTRWKQGIWNRTATNARLLKGRCVTTAYTDEADVVVAEGVYAPQQDSQLLIDVMEKSGLAAGHRVADLCTGSGVVAIAAARQGASVVTAFDICPRAVRCARANALAAGVDAEVYLGSWARAMEFGPFDLVVCNPPYLPHASDEPELMPAEGDAARAVNAGLDGRLVLDPLCVAAPELLVAAAPCWWCIRSSRGLRPA